MKFEGEHLLPGQIGHFFVLLAFIASIISTIGFFKASRTTDILSKESWLKFSRICFGIQAFSILAIFSTIYFICSNHYFEYLSKFAIDFNLLCDACQKHPRSLKTNNLPSGCGRRLRVWAFDHRPLLSPTSSTCVIGERASRRTPRATGCSANPSPCKTNCVCWRTGCT